MVGVTRQTINKVEYGKSPLPKTLYLALRYVLDGKLRGMTWSLVRTIVETPELYSPIYRKFAILSAKDIADKIYKHQINEEEALIEWKNIILTMENNIKGE